MEASMNAHIITLARYYAKREVKAQLQAQGLKLQAIEASELAKAARAYLGEHPELIDQAKAWLGSNVRTHAQKSKA
jgi:hypothetical protein